MYVKYKGEKFPKVVDLPVPLTSLAEREGQVTFTEAEPVQEVPISSAMHLVTCGGLYEKAEKEEPGNKAPGVGQGDVPVFQAIALKLMESEGLNHSAYCRAKGLNSKNQNDRRAIRPESEQAIRFAEKLVAEGKAHKRNNDYFLNKK